MREMQRCHVHSIICINYKCYKYYIILFKASEKVLCVYGGVCVCVCRAL